MWRDTESPVFAWLTSTSQKATMKHGGEKIAPEMWGEAV